MPKAPEYREPLLDGVAHIEFCPGNASPAAHCHRLAFGFDGVAYSRPETGTRDRDSCGLRHGDVRMGMTVPLAPDGDIADHVRLHGDGVRALAFQGEDAASAYHDAVARAARPASEPHAVEDQSGAI
ncbi:4-hydroxyphenylpyruvate dioxygenase, partial [mine drainage metagenome]